MRANPPHRPKPLVQSAALLSSAPAPPSSFAEVINLWPNAHDLAVVLDVEPVTVRAWRRRGIPARYWRAVAEAARLTGRPVDERLLAELASIRRAFLRE